MIMPLTAPLEPGRKMSASGPVTVVPDLRSYRYEPRPHRFSPVQSILVQLVCCGLADKEIAYLLGVSSATVKAHMSRVIRDMGLYRRHQLVRFIFENKLFDPEGAQAALLKRRAKRSAARTIARNEREMA